MTSSRLLMDVKNEIELLNETNIFTLFTKRSFYVLSDKNAIGKLKKMCYFANQYKVMQL